MKPKPKEKEALDEVSEEVEDVEEEEGEEESKEGGDAVEEITEMIGEAKMYYLFSDLSTFYILRNYSSLDEE